MRKLMIALAALALALPAVALAGRPSHPSPPAAKPTVLWVLRGQLSNYKAASGSTKGSISINVASSNLDRMTLKGMKLTFTTDSRTVVVLHEGKSIANGDRGIVKVRAGKGSNATQLQTLTAFEVIDQGSAR